MTSPLLSLPGAVPADPPDAGVAWHYGDPLREQRGLAAGEGFVDLSHREVVRVAGPDRLTWLHSLTSQHLERLEPREASTALVLSPQGRVEHALALVDDGTAVWAHVEPGTSGALVDFLTMMRFRADVDVADVTAEYAVVWEPGGDGETPYLARAGARGRELFVPRAELPAYAERRGSPAGVWAYEALRIAAHEPRFGRDTDHKTIPHEVGWIGTAVHLDKGCYRGQETVARVHNTGHPPRRLVFLHFDGSVETLPAHGDAVEDGGREVGVVTSSARHHELGPIGLALVKRAVPVDATLFAAGVPAAQEVVVSPDAGLHLRPKQLLSRD
ncbi:MAG: folate-binding protein YgfZ [Streptosporangiales bacterium]|nr:folate-binding protein YgfZ [Streptosporangiales bacterium]MBO0889459.1 folate-binding protein YgfZ [Acidothermales bacterium]